MNYNVILIIDVNVCLELYVQSIGKEKRHTTHNLKIWNSNWMTLTDIKQTEDGWTFKFQPPLDQDKKQDTWIEEYIWVAQVFKWHSSVISHAETTKT